MRSSFERLASACRPPIAVREQDCVDPVGMGQSMGVAGVPTSTGTVGGYVQIKYKGTVHTMALTCHNALDSPSTSQGKRSTDGLILTYAEQKRKSTVILQILMGMSTSALQVTLMSSRRLKYPNRPARATGQ